MGGRPGLLPTLTIFPVPFNPMPSVFTPQDLNNGTMLSYMALSPSVSYTPSSTFSSARAAISPCATWAKFWVGCSSLSTSLAENQCARGLATTCSSSCHSWLQLLQWKAAAGSSPGDRDGCLHLGQATAWHVWASYHARARLLAHFSVPPTSLHSTAIILGSGVGREAISFPANS